MARYHSDLEAVPPHSNLEVAYDHTAPIHVPSHVEKIPAVSEYSEQPHPGSSGFDCSPELLHPSEAPPAKKRRICGLSLRTFIVLVVALVVVVAGAIGGGIAGAQAAAKNKNEAASSSDPVGDATASSASPTGAAAPRQSATATATSASATATPSVITKTQLRNPKNANEMLESDCPSSNDTVYHAIGSPMFQFRKLCANKYVGYGVVVVNERVGSLDDCIDRCVQWNVGRKDDIRAGDANICNSVCWRGSWDQDLPGQCFGFPIQNTTEGTWRVGEGSTKDVRCDSAAWMNPYTL